MDDFSLLRLKAVARKMGLRNYSAKTKPEILQQIKRALLGAPDVWRGSYINFSQPNKSRSYKEAEKKGDIYLWAGTRKSLKQKGRQPSASPRAKVKKSDSEEMKRLKQWHKELKAKKRRVKSAERKAVSSRKMYVVVGGVARVAHENTKGIYYTKDGKRVYTKKTPILGEKPKK